MCANHTQTFPPSEFDEWAENYDDTVRQNRSFPFLGYEDLLDAVVKIANPALGMHVLDLGSGTGNLAQRFYDAGCKVWCTDFSPAMLEKAKQKLPEARFALYDLSVPYPKNIPARFDRIVSAFTFHHFPIDEKVRIIRSLLSHLLPGGSIVIGDISFTDIASMENIRHKYKDDWEEEYYWLADIDSKEFEISGAELKFWQISEFLGVYLLRQ